MRLALVFITFLLGSALTYGQFLHLSANEKSDYKSVIVFLDGSTQSGYVKNNGMKNVALRILEFNNNRFAFSNPEILVDDILFKKDDSDKYEKIDVDDIDKVLFFDENSRSLTYKKIDYHEVNLKKKEIKEKTGRIFLLDQNLSGFERYYYITIKKTSHNGGSKEYSFYVKNPVNGKFYYLNKTPFTSNKSLYNFFKMIGSECPEYVEFVDKLSNKKSEEFSQMNQAKDPYLEPRIKALNDQDIKDYDDYFAATVGIHFDFYFFYLSQKYIFFGCPGLDQFIE